MKQEVPESLNSLPGCLAEMGNNQNSEGILMGLGDAHNSED